MDAAATSLMTSVTFPSNSDEFTLKKRNTKNQNTKKTTQARPGHFVENLWSAEKTGKLTSASDIVFGGPTPRGHAHQQHQKPISAADT